MLRWHAKPTLYQPSCSPNPVRGTWGSPHVALACINLSSSLFCFSSEDPLTGMLRWSTQEAEHPPQVLSPSIVLKDPTGLRSLTVPAVTRKLFIAFLLCGRGWRYRLIKPHTDSTAVGRDRGAVITGKSQK